jgi:6-phosphogluconate dehydrogenase (decarboxylating)
MNLTNKELVSAMRDRRKIPLPYFGGALAELDFDSEIELLEFADVIRNFLQKNESDRLRDTKHAWAYFLDFVEDVGMECAEDGMADLERGSAAIWNFVRPIYLNATESWEVTDKNTERKFVVLDCRCGWEIEHGMMMSWREGTELVKVSGYDGHPTNGHAFDDLTQDQWVYCGNNLQHNTRRTLT